MSRLVVPVAGQILWATGDVRLWCELSLDLKDTTGNFHRHEFRVDSATDVTTFPAYDAKLAGLAIPLVATPGVRHEQTGLEIRSGFLQFRIPGLPPNDYAVGCLFLGDPDAPPDPSQPATFPRKLLQPFQLLDRLKFTADKDPATGSLYGDLTIEKK
jgi:hypothetical protein